MPHTHPHPLPQPHEDLQPHEDRHAHTPPEAHAHTHAPLPAPSREGTVVLEIGGELGALILHTGPAEDGLEIEVSPLGNDDHRTHAAVRPRLLADRTVHCAVISPLPAGRYTVWRDHETGAAQVDVPPGGVAELRWPPADS
ncbi:hypothetical protein [Streptacidiphilus sp. EB129]|jgi:hypothetical protein|uniref:hypothetical protein n=1 Tax=Streptacidiphilus sp. EB129 TaxID=3156262 RepID=UPI0035111527